MGEYGMYVELNVPLTLCLDMVILREMIERAGMDQPDDLDAWVDTHRGQLLDAAYKQIEGDLTNRGDDIATLVFERAMQQDQEDR